MRGLIRVAGFVAATQALALLKIDARVAAEFPLLNVIPESDRPSPRVRTQACVGRFEVAK